MERGGHRRKLLQLGSIYPKNLAPPVNSSVGWKWPFASYSDGAFSDFDSDETPETAQSPCNDQPSQRFAARRSNPQIDDLLALACAIELRDLLNATAECVFFFGVPARSPWYRSLFSSRWSTLPEIAGAIAKRMLRRCVSDQQDQTDCVFPPPKRLRKKTFAAVLAPYSIMFSQPPPSLYVRKATDRLLLGKKSHHFSFVPITFSFAEAVFTSHRL